MDDLFSLRLIPSDDVLVRELEQEAVVLHLGEEAYYGLNRTGMRMWSLVTTKESVREALEALARQYRVGRETLERDLASFVRTLLDKKMVTIQP